MIDSIAAAAEEAGSILLRMASGELSVGSKEGRELVTEADLASQRFLRERLSRVVPEAGFVGEEGWDGGFPEPPFWVVDPLDGTNNYVSGYPVWCVSIALCDGDGVLAACVSDPGRGETFTAMRGRGASLDGGRIGTSAAARPEECLVATGFPYHRREGQLGVDLSVLARFLERVRGVRRGGSAALDLAYVACGRLDGYWEEHLKPWDMAAGVLLVREAGGRVSDWAEGGWSLGSGGMIASAPAVHEDMVGLVRGRR